MWRVKATVKLKDGVLDVQGRAIESVMKQMGYTDVQDLRIGKHVEFLLGSEPSVAKLKEIGDGLLANPVIETIEFSVQGEK